MSFWRSLRHDTTPPTFSTKATIYESLTGDPFNKKVKGKFVDLMGTWSYSSNRKCPRLRNWLIWDENQGVKNFGTLTLKGLFQIPMLLRHVKYTCWGPTRHHPSAGTGRDFSPSAGTGTCRSPNRHRANMGRPVPKLGEKKYPSSNTGRPVLELDFQCRNWIRAL